MHKGHAQGREEGFRDGVTQGKEDSQKHFAKMAEKQAP
jgi:flagellar biosynthesis/type III secretory pathway protein FliH